MKTADVNIIMSNLKNQQNNFHLFLISQKYGFVLMFLKNKI